VGITVFVVSWGCPKRIGNISSEFDNWFYLNKSQLEVTRLKEYDLDRHVPKKNEITFTQFTHNSKTCILKLAVTFKDVNKSMPIDNAKAIFRKLKHSAFLLGFLQHINCFGVTSE
jgi:hypothetical protein